MNLTRILLLALFLSPLSFVSYAQHNGGRCLTHASDDALLDELSRRLNESTRPIHPVESSIPTFSCYRSTLQIGLINQEGRESRESTVVSSSQDCTEYSALFNTKISLVEDRKMIAVCYRSTLNRYLLHPSGSIQRLSSQSTSDSAACDREAAVINDRL